MKKFIAIFLILLSCLSIKGQGLAWDAVTNNEWAGYRIYTLELGYITNTFTNYWVIPTNIFASNSVLTFYATTYTVYGIESDPTTNTVIYTNADITLPYVMTAPVVTRNNWYKSRGKINYDLAWTASSKYDMVTSYKVLLERWDVNPVISNYYTTTNTFLSGNTGNSGGSYRWAVWAVSPKYGLSPSSPYTYSR